MNREVRLFLHGLHETSSWDSLIALTVLSFSPQARRRKRRYQEVQRMFTIALSDPDALIQVELKALPKSSSKRSNMWFVFAILAVVGVLEWSVYSLPALSDSIGTILHKCGLR